MFSALHRLSVGDRSTEVAGGTAGIRGLLLVSELSKQKHLHENLTISVIRNE